MSVFRRIIGCVLCLGILTNLGADALAKTQHKKSKTYATKSHHSSYRAKKPRARKKTISTYTRAPAVIYGTQQLAAELNRIIYSADPNARIGVQIKSMRHGDILYSQGQYHSFIPASTIKVLTAEVALLFLGPDFRFSTRLMTDAKSFYDGTLHGNIYIVYSGDPTLTYTNLSELLQNLGDQGIHTINGNIYIDNSAYDQINTAPGWDPKDKSFCYAAPVNASIINRNCMQGSGTAISNPLTYNRLLITHLLQQLKIQMYGSIESGIAPRMAKTLGNHESKPLNQIVTQMLKKSDNIIAGSLFKKIGSLYHHSPGTWNNGSKALQAILEEYTGMNSSSIYVIDGSGLSRNNHIAPAQMMEILDFAYHHPNTNYDFISALPIAGVDGTLKNRLHNVAGKVRAKTGSMSRSGIFSLAGYMTTKDKEPMAFVIMVNGRNGLGWKYKSIEDKIITAIAKYSRGE